MSVIAVTGTGSLVGQAIIKSIKKSPFKNNKLIGMDYFDSTVGSYWVDHNYILPDMLSNNITNEAWISSIISIIQKNEVKILFIGVDFELNLFAKYKKYIEEVTKCIVVVSSENAIKVADDKYLTYQFLKDCQLNHPLTFLEGEIDSAINKKEIFFPMIVKPRNGYRSIDVYVVNNKSELNNAVLKIKNPVIQECIGDDGSEYTCGVIAIDGSVKQSIILRRDLKDGNTSKTYLKNNFPESIREYIEAAAANLDQFGVCNFQLRVDNKGVPKIFEINARHSGTTYIRSLYGFNEIEYLLEYFLNQKEIKFKIKEGIVQRYFEEFFVESLM